ncbi:MAG: DUF4123 domain-containing protein [Pseudomonadota bacterium]
MLIDSYHDRWLDRLNSAVSGGTTYLLIDGVFVPGLYRLLNAALPSPQAATLLFETLPSCTDKTRDVSPFIVRYDPANLRMQTLLQRCSGRPMISAIETAESQNELTERLSAWCVVEAGDQRFNFRFPDTRRLPSIFATLTAEQRIQLAGAATRWSYVDRSGSWAELDVFGVPSAIADRPRLDDQQFSRLVDASEVDEVIAILVDRGNGMSHKHSEIYSGLAIALQTATRRNLESESKIQWCESCWREGLPHDEFEATDRLTTWIDASKSLSVTKER